jgi:hypothetical protein
VVALVRAYHPKLSAADVVRRIELTADHPPGALPDPQLGWGVVNPYAAVAAVLPQEGPQGVAVPSGSPVPLAALPPPHDSRPAVAYLLAGLAVAVAGLAGVAARVVSLGRRRGWRPGRADPPRQSR